MASSPNPPICAFCRRQPVDPVWRPFCSERCKIQDLASWASGTYRVSGDAVTEDDSKERDEP